MYQRVDSQECDRRPRGRKKARLRVAVHSNASVGNSMNKPESPRVKVATPPVMPEVAAEIERRLDPSVYQAEKAAARPATEVLERLATRHSRPR